MMGSASFANPGSIPEVKHDVPPLRHAASSRATSSAGAPGGNTIGTTEVETTFFPASRMRQRSSTASGSRTSAVAV
jgi:hypothetical protein